MQLAEMEFSRPLTHDLLCSVLSGLGGALQKVIITKVQKSTYYAELIVRRNGEVISLDARPSDSIAVALRVDARIFADEQLLEVASIEIAEDESTSEPGLERLERIETDASMGPEELKEHLRGLNPEDFGRFTP
jgi:bifunctional DNase/RNase